VLQTGGSDQWGNLTSGVDLIKRAEGATAHAIGTPLITNSDGRKFGKSEGNAIWLDEKRTTPYAMYQFWLNTDDADVVDRLKVFTFLSRARIEELAAATANEPFRREAQRVLATEVTSLIHGETAVAASVAAADALFGQGDLVALDESTLASVIAELPTADATAGSLIAQVLFDAGLVTSLGEARRAISQGGVYLNNAKVESETDELGASVLAGGVWILRRGKKTLAGIRDSARA
jgi:tyrosyl-tRNA synthetase